LVIQWLRNKRFGVATIANGKAIEQVVSIRKVEFEVAPVDKKDGVLSMYRANITINGIVYTVGVRKTLAGNKFYYIKPKV